MSTLSYSAIISSAASTAANPRPNGASVPIRRPKGCRSGTGRSRALWDISLDVPERSVVALIGPSGCGKSTFLRCLNRMNDLIEGTPHVGELALDGVDIYDRTVNLVDLRRRVGMVFQKSNPFPKSVYENVV